MKVHRAAALLAALMIVNLLAWYLWWSPPVRVPLWLTLVTLLVPLGLALAALLSERPTAPFWAGVLALFYFSHGVSEAWTVPAARLPATIAALLSAALVVVPATLVRRGRKESRNRLQRRFADDEAR